MRKTIEAMYYDNLSISGRSLNKIGEYYRTEQEVCNVAVKLEETLTTQQKELWQEYTALSMKANDLGCRDNFILGLRTASCLLVEALADTSDDESVPIAG